MYYGTSLFIYRGDINMCPNTLQAHEEKKQCSAMKEIEIFHKKVPPMREKICCKC